MPESHALTPELRARVLELLTQMEAEQGLRVLWACEAGSRGAGCGTAESPYVLRFIYVHPLPWYLHVLPEPDSIERSLPWGLDVQGWELRKALSQVHRGHPAVAEWLSSPLVFRAEAAFAGELRRVTRGAHQPERALAHYLSLARRQYRDWLAGGELSGPGPARQMLALLRNLLAALWLEAERSAPPLALAALMDGVLDNLSLRQAVEHAQVLQHLHHNPSRAGPGGGVGAGASARPALSAGPGSVDPLPMLGRYVHKELARLSARLQVPDVVPSSRPLDLLLHDTVVQRDKDLLSIDLNEAFLPPEVVHSHHNSPDRGNRLERASDAYGQTFGLPTPVPFGVSEAHLADVLERALALGRPVPADFDWYPALPPGAVA